MLQKLEAISRHVVGNRRRHPRRRSRYTVVVRDTLGREIFRGRTINLSRSGVKLSGFFAGLGISQGQQVRVEFLVLPKDSCQISRRYPVKGVVSRIHETPDDTLVAVTFNEPLPG
jgi:hypothetical protein